MEKYGYDLRQNAIVFFVCGSKLTVLTAKSKMDLPVIACFSFLSTA